MGGKAWSEEDEKRLVSAYESGMPIPKIIAMFPNRTAQSVKCYACKIGAKHPEHRPWSPEEEAILAEIWADPRVLKVGMRRLPGRTYDAARVHAKAIGLGDKEAAQKGSRSPFFNDFVSLVKKHGPLTAFELSRLVKTTVRTVHRVMADCHGAEFHIGGWKNERSKNLSIMWAIGPGPDVEKPEPKATLEVYKDYRDRKRIKAGKFDPFASIAGLVTIPQGQRGRVFQQPMTIKDEEELAA